MRLTPEDDSIPPCACVVATKLTLYFGSLPPSRIDNYGPRPLPSNPHPNLHEYSFCLFGSRNPQTAPVTFRTALTITTGRNSSLEEAEPLWIPYNWPISFIRRRYRNHSVTKCFSCRRLQRLCIKIVKCLMIYIERMKIESSHLLFKSPILLRWKRLQFSGNLT